MMNDPQNQQAVPGGDDNENDMAHEAVDDSAPSSFADSVDGAAPDSTSSPAQDDRDQKIAILEAELEKTKEQMLRALADSENTRKRALRDREDAGKYAISSFARDLLDFADNFSRALQSIPEELKEEDDRIKNTIIGIEAMEKELLKVFEKQGITKIDPMDEPFNPNFHEVMFEAPVAGKSAGTIIQVIEPGYILNERLLRPARVGIAKADPGDNSAQDPSSPGNQLDTEV